MVLTIIFLILRNHVRKKEALHRKRYFAFHFIMQKEIRDLFPKWIDEIDNSKHVSGFTADMDGLLCASFAKKHLKLEVNAFYDFKSLSKINPLDKRETIFFDCALNRGKTFDNHITKLAKLTYCNPQSANINSVLGNHRGEYADKFAMSTLIQLYALYDIPLPQTLEGKMILLCVDVGFKGYYSPVYKRHFLSYLEMFGMLELVKILEKFTENQMYQFMLKHKMDMAITKKDGSLLINKKVNLDFLSEHLGYPVQLPQNQFEVVQEFDTKSLPAWRFGKKEERMAFSWACINSQTVMVSFKKEDNYG